MLNVVMINVIILSITTSRTFDKYKLTYNVTELITAVKSFI
jgi:hypothetical protein